MIAFTFPGQGSQRPGMGGPWRTHPSWELVDEAAEATGRDVAALLLDADGDELLLTRNSQLATFVLSMVVLDAAERVGISPAIVAGHSLGEYSALVAAGALAFADGAALVAERGEAMQQAAEEHHGAMAAVLGLDDDDVEVACARTDGDVWVANYNGAGQVVIAGDPVGVAAAGDAARELGAKRVLNVAVSGAFHTPFMAPARDRLRKALAGATFRDSDVDVVTNVDALAHTDAADWPGLLTSQLCNPVRWRQTLSRFADAGVSIAIELGPGAVLTGLAKRSLPGAHAVNVSNPDDLDRLLEVVHGPLPRGAAVHEGEHLFATERLVVSPGAGVFTPRALAPGEPVQAGDVIGLVATDEVRSPFAGHLMGYLALEGERVTSSQPLLWLRSA